MTALKKISPTKQHPLSRILASVRWTLFSAVVFAAVGAMFTMVPLAAMAALGQMLFDSDGITTRGMADFDWRGFAEIIAVSMVCLLVGMGLSSLAELLAHLADGRCSHDLRMSVAQRLMQVPLGWFTQRSSGEVKQVLQDDVATLHALTAHFYTAVGRAAGSISIAVIYLLVLDWGMTVLVMLPFAGFFWFLRHALRAGQANMATFVTQMTRINGATVEFVRAMPVVKAFGAVGRAHQGFSAAVDDFAASFANFVRPLVRAMAHAHAMISPITILTVVLLTGYVWVSMGWMRPIDVLPFVLVAPGISAPLLLLHTLLHELDSAKAAAQRVVTVLDAPTLASMQPICSQFPTQSKLQFENVSMTYANGHAALRNINLTLEPGTVTAIVGPSGAGKSTLARLLLRFFDPDQGRITYGGVDLRHLETSALYQHVGFVLQEVQLIHASVRDNLALGRPAATQSEIENVARAVNMHDQIMRLPQGYDTIVGEDAVFSGGESQRLSIARALLLDPPVLVLDEATASVDAQNEVAIQEALAVLMPGRTLMVIAHRLETVMHADNICVLDAGALVESGTHAELLARNGCYARLWANGGYAHREDVTAAAKGGASC